MEPRNVESLEIALRALRPAPSPAFAAELDARVAADFPAAAGRRRLATLSRFAAHLQAVPVGRLLVPAAACALVGVAVATAVVATSEGGRDGTIAARPIPAAEPNAPSGTGRAIPKPFPGATAAPATAASGTSNGEFSKKLPGAKATPRSAPASKASTGAVESDSGPFAATARHREVVRDAQIVLGTDAAGLRDAAARVLGVVHDYDGIVLRSSIRDGGDSASASFDLLIPSDKLGDALANFSDIAEVRSRHESSADVTAPAIGLQERLRDARAKVEGLLAQLAAASTEAERAATETELRAAHRHVAALRARQTTLQRRVHLSRVSLRIETAPSVAGDSGSDHWGIDDAFRDAGHILTIAAGVTLIGLSVVTPIALLCLLAWLAHCAWVRRRREGALD